MTKTMAVILNPEAGRGKGGKYAAQVGAALHRRGIDAVLLLAGSAGETLDMARKTVADGVDAVLAAGGDGTINLAVQAVAGTDVPLGIVPLGTCNDNAKLMEIPRKDLAAAVDVIADFNVRTIDAGHVKTSDGRELWFMGVLSSGFDSSANERANRMRWPKGKLRYLIAMAVELGVLKPIAYRIDVDGAVKEGRGTLVAVGNGVSYGGGVKMCIGAEPDDGLLTLTWLRGTSRRQLLRSYPGMYKGTHVQRDEVEQFHGRSIHLEAAGQIIYADGERVGPLPADIELVPGALKVLVPA